MIVQEFSTNLFSITSKPAMQRAGVENRAGPKQELIST